MVKENEIYMYKEYYSSIKKNKTILFSGKVDGTGDIR
jgi:hypothetical protein